MVKAAGGCKRESAMQVSTSGATVILAGRFDVRSTGQVREVLYQQINQSRDDVIVDLSGLESIDATALKVLAAATRVMERSGRHLILRGCTPGLRRIIALTRLHRLVQIERGAITA